MPNSPGSSWGLWQQCGLARNQCKERQHRSCLSERGGPALQEKPSWAPSNHSLGSASVFCCQVHGPSPRAALLCQQSVFRLLIPGFKVSGAVSLPSRPASTFEFDCLQGCTKLHEMLPIPNPKPMVPLLGVGIMMKREWRKPTVARGNSGRPEE